ncbi:MAG: hypothetical protein JRF62_10260, partial [Deltaproteobacteria bacterium]|nr:hypothetical protein [Deltaproteobacteria bacterium]
IYSVNEGQQVGKGKQPAEWAAEAGETGPGKEHDIIKEIDINPVIISEGKGIAVDALIVLEPSPIEN